MGSFHENVKVWTVLQWFDYSREPEVQRSIFTFIVVGVLDFLHIDTSCACLLEENFVQFWFHDVIGFYCPYVPLTSLRILCICGNWSRSQTVSPCWYLLKRLYADSTSLNFSGAWRWRPQGTENKSQSSQVMKLSLVQFYYICDSHLRSSLFMNIVLVCLDSFSTKVGWILLQCSNNVPM